MEELSPQPASPRVSILIVLRPGSPSIEPLLEAFTAGGSPESLEIAVLDNGARLVTGEWEDRFPAVSFRKLPRFFGYTKAINILARTAQGEHFLFWDPSLQPTPATVTQLLAALDAQPDAGGVCPMVVDEQGGAALPAYQLPSAAGFSSAWRSAALPAAPGETAPGQPYAVECVGLPAMLVRREFVRGMNFFDDHYGEFGSLLEMCFQLRQANRQLLVVPDARVTRRPADESGSVRDPAQEAADFALGASRYLSRRHGFGAGLAFRLKTAAGSLGRALTFQSPGRNLRHFWLIASGQKIDGTQSQS